ncbi:hypothetical protein D9M68_174280 [compost metagenome]
MNFRWRGKQELNGAVINYTGRLEPPGLLKCAESVTRLLPPDAVDDTGVETLRKKGLLNFEERFACSKGRGRKAED